MKTTRILIFLTIFLFIFSGFSGCSAKKKEVRYPVRLKTGTAEHYLHEGLFYLNNGNINVAEKKLLKALKKKPTLIGAINGLGIVYLQRREFQKAIQYFNQVTRINPESYDAYNYLGVIYTELGEYSLAKENLLRAANAEKYNTPENAYVNLALLEIRQERFDAALRYVEKGLEKNQRFPPLSNLMGVILENQEKYQEALEWYEKALSLLTEEDVTYLVNIGRIYSKLGQKDKALDTLEKALSKAYSLEMKKQIRSMIQNLEKQE
ncbi:MAG: tetratricopeptide repeat protein [Candidatus Aminicenantes bacterium]|nr:MAG: tetratricopeptide repeat protein [Candidatus Aminicenantes bacterium]